MSRILADAKSAPPRVGCVLLRCRLGARGRDLPGNEGFPLVSPAERRELEQALAVLAGRVLEVAPSDVLPGGHAVHGGPGATRTSTTESTVGPLPRPSADHANEPSEPAVFFVDPSDTVDRFGGADAWARSIKGYLNARGYGASVAVAGSVDQALAAARSRWGTVVVHTGHSIPPPAPVTRSQPEFATRPQNDASDPRFITAVGVRAPSVTEPAGVTMKLAGLPAAAPARGGRAGSPQLALPGLKLGKPKRASRG